MASVSEGISREFQEDIKGFTFFIDLDANTDAGKRKRR